MADASGDKTEKATPKKRSDSRKEGQVLKSTDVNTAVSMAAMFFIVSVMGPSIVRHASEMLSRYLGGHALERITPANVPVVFNEALYSMLIVSLPLLLTAVVIGVLTNIIQSGFLFTTKILRPKFSKMNPLKGFRRMISIRSFVELIKSLLKLSAIGAIVYNAFVSELSMFPQMMDYSLFQSGERIFRMSLSIGFRAAVALILVGVADYMYSWFEYEKNLRMTKQEIKDEYKMIEGDPQIKGKIKQKQREIASRRMMQSVPSADVVITNPTHYAVALQYNDDGVSAPILTAKGADYVALKIRKVALEHGVEVVENKMVAQTVYQTVDIGEPVPESLYQAVAEILAYVYNLRNKNVTHGSRE